MSQKETKTIKRYRNRKLYDTVDSCYVTLEEIGDMIKGGEDVRIIENRTQEDITAMTLAQIIFDEQKRKTNTLPLSLFTHIIRNSGGAIRDLVAKTIETGAREIGHVREFVDERLKSSNEMRSEIEGLKEKLLRLEERLERSD